MGLGVLIFTIIPTGDWGHREADKRWRKTDGAWCGEDPMAYSSGGKFYLNGVSAFVQTWLGALISSILEAIQSALRHHYIIYSLCPNPLEFSFCWFNDDNNKYASKLLNKETLGF